MKLYKVFQDLDYVSGHLRYGHLEGTVEAESAEEAIALVKDDPLGYLSIIIDDYELEDWNEGDNPIEVEEIE